MHLQLADDAERAYLLAVSPSGEVSLERFAQLLALHGHHVWLRTGRLECCFGHVALRHTFILAGMLAAAAATAVHLAAGRSLRGTCPYTVFICTQHAALM